MSKVKVPKGQKDRLKRIASLHNQGSVDNFALHLVEVGLTHHGEDDKSVKLKARLNNVVDEMGYSSREELIEHLIERGLRAYEDPADSREKLEERLRGLGYIE
tara:strand:+ start:512 stop:820 length:309 start_codon:yes stop_codon:yes gene_type:complete